jgi:ferredoxin
MISRDVLQGLLPIDDYDFYLCGPPPFMQAIYAMLRELGVPKHRIAYEFFGPATVLEPDAMRIPAVPAQPARVEPAGEATTVEFRKSGLTAVWDGSAASLLDFAENQGLLPEFSCRAGICGTCKSRLILGDVTYFEEPLDELGAGEVLLCCSKPRGSVVLDI